MPSNFIPLVYEKNTGGTPVGTQEVQVADQIGNQWLAMPAGYIEGLALEWVSASSIRVTSGACSLATGGTINFSASITKAGISLGNNAAGHVYAFLNGITPDIEIVSAAPSSPYRGTARTKTGDTTRRYLGTVKTDGSGNIINFKHNWMAGRIYWLALSRVAPFRILSNGTATTSTVVDATSVVAPSAVSLKARAVSTSATAGAYISNPDYSSASFSTLLISLSPRQDIHVDIILSAALSFNYTMDSSDSNGLYVDVLGYDFTR